MVVSEWNKKNTAAKQYVHSSSHGNQDGTQHNDNMEGTNGG